MHNRSIRFRVRRKKSKALDLDITSLLDILVIILVFLIKNFNASGIVINVPKSIKLPLATSIEKRSPGIVIQVSRENIFLEDKLIFNIEENIEDSFDKEDAKILNLYNHLLELETSKKILNLRKQSLKENSQIDVNLVIDKKVPYSMVKSIMYTCGLLGYSTFRFIVREKF